MANQTKDQLLEKIKSRKSIVGIIGMGYVGLPLALRFSDEGFPVVGFDIDPFKISALNEGRSYIKHFESSLVAKAVKNGFTATDKFEKAKECDALIICVPTPLSKYRDPDISFIVETMKSVKPFLRKGQLVSLESTTYPGTTDEVLLPMIEEQGLKVGEDVFLVFSPEREDPGNPNFETKTIPKVCGGHTESCLKIGSALYASVIDKVVEVSSTRTAEMTKLLENIQRAVNIGLMNEMKVVCERMGLDVFEVIRAASTKPFGFTPYFPGPGLGGHCIPIDPFYLTWKAKEYGLNTKFIELAGEINTAMPQYVIEKIVEALNSRKKSVNGAKILVSGIAYKKNVDDMRESPAVHIMEMLRDKGAALDYYDPYVPTFPKMREHRFELKSVDFNEATLSKYDCVVLTTDHGNVDYKKMLEWAHLIVDTRGVYQTRNEKVVRA